MICPRCKHTIADNAPQCTCGYRFDHIAPEELPAWFEEYRHLIEQAYLSVHHPWQQSGKSGTFEEWTRLRIPISECVTNSGSFLDIGCANGFLLECMIDWTRKKGVKIAPYGLDMSERMLEMARERLPHFKNQLFLGNALDWQPPLRFDYVRVSLEYVPHNYHARLIQRLLAEFLTSTGSLLVAQYRSHKDHLRQGWVDAYLRSLGFTIDNRVSGYNKDGLELCRVAVLTSA